MEHVAFVTPFERINSDFPGVLQGDVSIELPHSMLYLNPGISTSFFLRLQQVMIEVAMR